MIPYFIPLLGSVVDSPLFTFLLLPILCLGIVSIVPCIIRSMVKGW